MERTPSMHPQHAPAGTAKIDRLGWAAGVSASVYGLRVGIRVSDASALDRALAVLPPGWKPAASPIVDRLYSLVTPDGPCGSRTRRYGRLYVDAERRLRTTDRDLVFDALESDLHMYLAEFARRRLFVHAGVVGWHGRAIVLPGRSFTGKSMLVAALVQAGATYYSDEYAVFDARGRVHPFARPLSIRGGPEDLPARLPVETFGSRAGTKPLPVGLVAVTRYRAGARWQPRPLPPGKAVLELLANTVAARHKPDVALRTLRHVVSGAHVLKGARGEAQQTAELILRRCMRGDNTAG